MVRVEGVHPLVGKARVVVDKVGAHILDESLKIEGGFGGGLTVCRVRVFGLAVLLVGPVRPV
jgi:hypothetical protein